MTRRFPQLLGALCALLTVSFLVASVARPDAHTATVAALASVVLLALVGARYAVAALRSRVLTVGSRSLEHRESFSSLPEPAHPHTAGRTRSRAPARPLAAA